MVAQTDRRGLAETGGDGVVGAFARERPHVGHHATLLAEDRHLNHVEDIAVLAQAVQSHREILGGLVVHLELDHGEIAVRRGRGRLASRLLVGLVEDQRAKAVAEAGQAARAETDAGAAEHAGARRRGERCVSDEVAQDRRTCRRHPLAEHAVVDHGEAAQQQGGRRRRDRQGAVRGLDPSGAKRQRPDAPAGSTAMGDEVGRGDDVGDGVPGADLVELDRLDGDAVHLGLGACQPFEDGDRRVAHRRLRGGHNEVGADIGPQPVTVAAAMGMFVMMARVVIVRLVGAMMMHLTAMLVVIGRGRRTVERDEEAAALQHAVVVRHQPAPDRRHGGDSGEHAGLKLGESVQQGGGEHVAGDAADGIELNVHGDARSSGAARA